MRNHSVRNTAWKVLGWTSFGLGIVAFTAGVCVKVPDASPATTKPVIGPVITVFKPLAAWIVILAAPSVGFLELIRSRIGAPSTWSAIRALINDFEERLFRKEGLRRDEHAITLFRYRLWSWTHPCSFSLLIPVERSGNSRRRTNTCFRISDSGGKASEGLAGQVYSSENVLSASNLPDLSEAYSETDLEQYAQMAFVNKEWLRDWVADKLKKGQKPPCSICVFPVEQGNGKLWGVLVLDSTKPDDLTRRATTYYDVMKKHLSILLERA